MSPDCEHPQCHEKMKLALSSKATKDDLGKVDACVKKKVSKKTLCVMGLPLFALIIIPLFITGVQVWSEQDADELRYATKDRVHNIEKDHATFQAIQRHIKLDIAEIKESQRSTHRDIKAIKEMLMRQ